MKYDKVIGIDPDVSKSGVAILNMEDKSLKVENLTFPQLIKLLMQNKAQCNFERKHMCRCDCPSQIVRREDFLLGQAPCKVGENVNLELKSYPSISNFTSQGSEQSEQYHS